MFSWKQLHDSIEFDEVAVGWPVNYDVFWRLKAIEELKNYS